MDQITIDIQVPEGADIEQFRACWNKYRQYGPGDLVAIAGILAANIQQYNGDVRYHTRVEGWQMATAVIGQLIEIHLNPFAPAVVPVMGEINASPEVARA